MDIFIAPAEGLRSFTCPYCGVLAQQHWHQIMYSPLGQAAVFNANVARLDFGRIVFCEACKKMSIWLHEEMIYPDTTSVPLPNSDLHDDIQADYREAASVLIRSPRSAAALLRLCIQKLCQQIGERGKRIDDDIKNLVQKGLPVEVQRSLDIVRVIGNESVHPGTLDISDDVETAQTLFQLVNFIADRMITQPKAIEALYAQLPQEKRNQIERRDKGST